MLVLLLAIFAVVGYAFPEGFYFTCRNMEPETFGVEGINLRNTWDVYAESRNPHDIGRSNGCTDSGTKLVCEVNWFTNNNVTTQFTMDFDITKLVVTATLVTPEGATATYPACRYGD